ncbi:MAG: lasso RiPP family leader peptide-containing protein [Burkholderiales bacterium]
MHNTGKDERSPPMSYSQPRLSRLGTFRELTRSGGAAFSDMFTTDGAGCAMHGSSSYTCTKP